MSDELDALTDAAALYSSSTVTLSPESLAVIFFVADYLFERSNWLNLGNPLDEVTDADWDTIEALVAGLYEEVS